MRPTPLSALHVLGATLLATTTVAAGVALACGGGAPVPPVGTPPDQAPYTAAYEILVVWSGEDLDSPTTIAVSADIHSPTDGFGYVVPIPEAISGDDLWVMNTETIDVFATVTGPRELTRACSDFRPDSVLVCPDPSPRNGSGGEGEGEGEGAGGESAGGVTVETVEVGDYEVSLLTADETDGLVAWLDDNNFSLPEASITHVESYLELGYTFAAVRVPPGTSVPAGSSMPSLAINLSGGLRTLPLLLGASAAKTTQDVVVYTVAPLIGQIGISNLAEVSTETHCMAPDNDFSGFFANAMEERHAATDTAVWSREYYHSTANYWDRWDVTSYIPLDADQVDALWEAGFDEYLPPGLGRLHIRYDPGQLTADPAFYTTGLEDFVAAEYYTYDVQLTRLIDTCGQGRTYAGSCPATIRDRRYCETDDDDSDTDKGGCSTTATPAPVGWLGVVGLVGLTLLRRRRSDQ